MWAPGGHCELFRGNAPDFPEIGYVELSPKSITHHMAPVYREAGTRDISRNLALESEVIIIQIILSMMIYDEKAAFPCSPSENCNFHFRKL